MEDLAMIERKSIILAIATALALSLACSDGTPPEDIETEQPVSGGRNGTADPVPIVDLDPDPANPGAYFAWYRTAPAKPESGLDTKKSKMDHSGSVFDDRADDRCPFREDLIDGAGVESFVVIGADGVVIADASKVRMQTYGETIPEDKRLRFEITIEREEAGNRLNWTVDDLSKPNEPPCELIPAEDFNVNVLPVEFKNLLMSSLREISDGEREASDFSFSTQP
jgi:hypothetical protein